MDSILNVNPGTIIWTLINFGILMLLLGKFAFPAIIKGLKAREEGIQSAIDDAHSANAKAQKLLSQSDEKLNNAQKEVSAIMAKGRLQAEKLLQKATEEADRIKKEKVDEAVRQIERQKTEAISQLRAEVADLVIGATEKLIGAKFGSDSDKSLINNYIDNLPKN